MSAARGVHFDFHVHTPVSRCYSDREATPEDLVRAAIEAGAEAIVVNDHHSAAALDDVRAAADGTTLAVFPGVEITTRHGHVVVLFDRDASSGCVWSLLRDLDVPDREHGNGHFRIRPSMTDVIEAASEAGGLAIPAHVDRWPNGFTEAQMERIERRRIHEHPAVAALEITLPETQSLWQSGSVPGFPRRLACIQGSDAHAIAEIGRRPTRVRIEALTIAGLRDAFAGIEDATELLPWR